MSHIGPDTVCRCPTCMANEYEWACSTNGVTLCVRKVGGGTLGRRYAGQWDYALFRNGQLAVEGNDLHTGAPKTHYEAVEELIDFLGLPFEL